MSFLINERNHTKIASLTSKIPCKNVSNANCRMCRSRVVASSEAVEAPAPAINVAVRSGNNADTEPADVVRPADTLPALGSAIDRRSLLHALGLCGGWVTAALEDPSCPFAGTVSWGDLSTLQCVVRTVLGSKPAARLRGPR